MPAAKSAWILPLLALAGLAGRASAGDLTDAEVFGLKTGDDRAAVRTFHPHVIFLEVPYEHPLIGTTYDQFYGRVAIERVEGQAQEQIGETYLSLTVRLTGDDRMYEVEASEQRASVDCSSFFASLVRLYGASTTREDDFRIQWLERDFDVDRRLDIQCFGSGETYWHLMDEGLYRDYMENLEAELAPYVEQAVSTRASPF